MTTVDSQHETPSQFSDDCTLRILVRELAPPPYTPDNAWDIRWIEATCFSTESEIARTLGEDDAKGHRIPDWAREFSSRMASLQSSCGAPREQLRDAKGGECAHQEESDASFRTLLSKARVDAAVSSEPPQHRAVALAVAFAASSALTSFIRDEPAWELVYPVWLYVLCGRVASLLTPNDTTLLREVASIYYLFGPDWDDEAKKLEAEADRLQESG